MLWIGVYDSVFQFLPKSSNFALPLKRNGPTFHSQQPDQLYAKEMCRTAWGKMVFTPDTDISDSPPPIPIWDQKMQICSPSHVKLEDKNILLWTIQATPVF